MITAGLTAYYMSRQVMLVFGGQARWIEHNDAHGAAGTAAGHEAGAGGSHGVAGEPHEAPWVMTMPLIVLGVALHDRLADQRPLRRPRLPRQVAGPGLPRHHRPCRSRWRRAPSGRSARLRWGCRSSACSPACVCGGRRRTGPSWSRPCWRTAGTSTRASPRPYPGPLPRIASAFSFGVDLGLIDGTINGLARLTAQTGRQLRRVQTGYVRNYALGIGIGAAIILAYVATRVGELTAVTSSMPILTIIVFLPLVGAAVVALIPSALERRLAKPIGMAFAVVELALVAYLVVDFQSGQAGFQFVSQHSWLSDFGISWEVGVDGISLFLVAMTALLFPVAMAGPTLVGNARAFMGWMLLLEAACMGTFLSMDLFLFFVMFEITLVPGYFIDRRLGRVPPELRGDEVLHLHLRRARPSCSWPSWPWSCSPPPPTTATRPSI